MSRATLTQAMGSAMGARIGMAVLNFGLFWMLSHRLGTAALGGFSLLMNVFFLAALLPLLGLSGPLTRRAATERSPEQLQAELSNALWFSAPVALALAVLIGVVAPLAYPPELRLPFALLGLAMLPSAVTLVDESTLVGMERMPDVARVQFGEALLRTAGSILAVSQGAGLAGVFAVFLALRVASATIYQFHPALPRPAWRLVSTAMQRRNWQEVPVFLGIVLLAALTSRLDMILLSRLDGLQVVGVYAAAARLYEASLMLPTIAALAMMPTLARLYASEPAQFRDTLVLALRLNLGVGFALALAVAALAQPLIGLIYRPEMADAAPVLRWLIFGAVLMTLDQILSSTMMAAKAQAHDLRALGIALVALVAGLAVLAPRLHATGAAIAVTLALVFRVAYRLHWVIDLLSLRGLAGDLGRLIGAAAIGIGGLLAGLVLGPWAALAGGLVAYALALRGLGVVGHASLAQWRAQVLGVFGRAG